MRKEGFSIIEALVAMVIIVIASLALALSMGNAARVNQNSQIRQKAFDAALERLEGVRSLGYTNAGMATGTASTDPTRTARWRGICEAFDPPPSSAEPRPGRFIGALGDATKCQNYTTGGDQRNLLVINPRLVIDPDAEPFDPRMASDTEVDIQRRVVGGATGDDNTGAAAGASDDCMINASTVFDCGFLLYTYIYWPPVRCNPGDNPAVDPPCANIRANYKLVTVVARYADSQGDPLRRFAVVTLTSRIYDLPGGGNLNLTIS